MFPTKEAFLSNIASLPFMGPEAVPYIQQDLLLNDFHVHNLANILQQEVIIRNYLQGIINIGINDETLTVFLRIKILGCHYNPDNTMILAFPSTPSLMPSLTRFFKFVHKCIGIECITQFAQKWLNTTVKPGRKRKNAGNTIWLIEQSQEPLILNAHGYLKCLFEVHHVHSIDLIRKAFASVDPFVEQLFNDM